MQAIERRSRRYLVIKGGGACLVALARERGVVNTVVELGVAGSLGVYRKEVTEGEHNK